MDGPYSQLKSWFLDDIQLLSENRQHFLIDRMSAGPSLFDDKVLLNEISEMRQAYDTLSDDGGPYPNEVFPWDHAAPERELLAADSDPAFRNEHVLDVHVGGILVDLASSDFA